MAREKWLADAQRPRDDPRVARSAAAAFEAQGPSVVCRRLGGFNLPLKLRFFESSTPRFFSKNLTDILKNWRAAASTITDHGEMGGIDERESKNETLRSSRSAGRPHPAVAARRGAMLAERLWLTICRPSRWRSTASAGKSHDPKGVHLSFGASDTTMVVTWTTRKETETNVRYGPSDPGWCDTRGPEHQTIGDARKFVDYGSTSSVRYVGVATPRGVAAGQRGTRSPAVGSASTVVEGVLVQRETHCGAVRRVAAAHHRAV